MATRETNPYRLLPKVEVVLQRPAVRELEERVGRGVLLEFIQVTLEAWRAEIQAGLGGADLTARLEAGGLERALEAAVERERKSGLRRAINATGVVLHTGLGRSALHPEVAEAMAEAARSYCVLEVDRFGGERNRRDDRLSVLLSRLTGAEAGIAVNNNAAAVLLTLSTFAAGRETIVSRGELVEIGGSFRMPDVCERAGTRLVEVGATNRTRIADYSRALGPETGLLLKVHRSNFRQIGFTEEVAAEELAELGREASVTSAFDLGSGLFELEGTPALPDLPGEPPVREVLSSGVDVVTCSGDKLLGGPQAGLLVGRRAAVEALRANHLYRALRLDKVAIAGLERTLELLLGGRGGELPVRAMLNASAEQMRARAEALAARLAPLSCLAVELRADASQPGSGSAPGVELETTVVRLEHADLSAAALARALRHAEPPVFARIQDEAVLLDPRTLLPGDEDQLVAALEAIAGGA